MDRFSSAGPMEAVCIVCWVGAIATVTVLALQFVLPGVAELAVPTLAMR